MCGSISVGFTGRRLQFTLRGPSFKQFGIEPISSSVDTFLENARRIFDVARMDSSEEVSDFTLLVRPDGSIHMVMECTVNPESAAQEHGAESAYRVSRRAGNVTVSGSHGVDRCSLSCAPERRQNRSLLPDQPLYWLAGRNSVSYLSSVPLRIASTS
jgi:hypothetical protein